MMQPLLQLLPTANGWEHRMPSLENLKLRA
jgi:hypothetical protein